MPVYRTRLIYEAPAQTGGRKAHTHDKKREGEIGKGMEREGESAMAPINMQ